LPNSSTLNPNNAFGVFLQSLLKEWKEYRIIIHNKNDESKADI
jgi:hypothetical protein